MKIVISAENSNGLEAPVSSHFGRCPYFAVVTVEENQIKGVESVANPYYPNHDPGQVPAFVHSLGADVMLSGGMGGRAFSFFAQYNIQVATGAAGTVGETVSAFLNGRLQGASPCSESIAHGHGDH